MESKGTGQAVVLACITAIGILYCAPILAYGYEGRVYYLPGHPYAWLYPAMELLGIAFQLATLRIRKLKLLLTGTLLVILGAILERDISLAVGDALAAAGLWYCMIAHKD